MLETISVIQSDPRKAGRPSLKNDPSCVRPSWSHKAAHSITDGIAEIDQPAPI